jgi:hypothetical protein
MITPNLPPNGYEPPAKPSFKMRVDAWSRRRSEPGKRALLYLVGLLLAAYFVYRIGAGFGAPAGPENRLIRSQMAPLPADTLRPPSR